MISWRGSMGGGPYATPGRLEHASHESRPVLAIEWTGTVISARQDTLARPSRRESCLARAEVSVCREREAALVQITSSGRPSGRMGF